MIQLRQRVPKHAVRLLDKITDPRVSGRTKDKKVGAHRVANPEAARSTLTGEHLAAYVGARRKAPGAR